MQSWRQGCCESDRWIHSCRLPLVYIRSSCLPHVPQRVTASLLPNSAGTSLHRQTGNMSGDPKAQVLDTLFGTRYHTPGAALQLPRKVPMRVEPKSYFGALLHS